MIVAYHRLQTSFQCDTSRRRRNPPFQAYSSNRIEMPRHDQMPAERRRCSAGRLPAPGATCGFGLRLERNYRRSPRFAQDTFFERAKGVFDALYAYRHHVWMFGEQIK